MYPSRELTNLTTFDLVAETNALLGRLAAGPPVEQRAETPMLAAVSVAQRRCYVCGQPCQLIDCDTCAKLAAVRVWMANNGGQGTEPYKGLLEVIAGRAAEIEEAGS